LRDSNFLNCISLEFLSFVLALANTTSLIISESKEEIDDLDDHDNNDDYDYDNIDDDDDNDVHLNKL
jgi:hypothetical protein